MAGATEDEKNYQYYLVGILTGTISLQRLPSKFMKRNLCYQAVTRDGWELFHVPRDLRTDSMIIEAIKNAPEVISIIPEDSRTCEMCLEAFRRDVRTKKYIPQKIRKEVYQRAYYTEGLQEYKN